MTNEKSQFRYAKNTHGQPNKNATYAKQRIDWANPQNASSKDGVTKPKGNTSSQYTWIITKKTKNATYFKQRIPWVFTGHWFDLNIPDCAYIKNIIFTVAMKISGNIEVHSPTATFCLYNGTKSVKTNIKNNNGWDNGYYHANPNRKLSTSWGYYRYEMSGDDFRKRGYPNSELNQTAMGIDLRFKESKKEYKGDHNIYIKYVSCKVEYEMPDQTITFDRVTDENNPRITVAGDRYDVTATYRNKSNAGCCNGTTKNVKITAPPNSEILLHDSSYTSLTPNTGIWKVKCTPNAKQTIDFGIRDYGIGNETINFHGDGVGDWNYYIYSALSSADTGKVKIYPDTMYRGLKGCVKFVSKVNISDGEANFLVDVDAWHDNKPDVTWTLVEEESSEGVTLLESDNTHVNFDVPTNQVVNIVWTGCFYPNYDETEQDYLITAKLAKGESDSAVYFLHDAPTFVVRNNPSTDENNGEIAEITFNPSVIQFVTHRVASSTEIGAYVIDCGVAPFDGEMATDNCTLTADVWRKHNYIGMVELPYSHYDPKSTYENKEIWKSYKNKTYAGKEGSIDEDISLKFKARPKDSIALQGLVELDKPTPINTNWQIWEGDPLNHRGWAVFSKIEIEKTNPLYYDYDATVRYITHDINTKFQIFKGDPVNKEKMPAILADTFTFGDNLATGLDTFAVDTDGGFVYDEDGDEGARNLFSLDDEQFLSIKTRKPLAEVSALRIDWYSTLVNELRENSVSRVFRIRDNSGESVFEYEYTNFNFETDYVTCTAIMRVKDAVEGWITSEYVDVDLRTEIEADPIADDGDEEASSDVSVDADTDSFVNTEKIITDSTQSDYDANAIIASYADDEISKIQIKVKDTENYLFNQTIAPSESYDVILSNIDLSRVSHEDIISFACYDENDEELTEYTEEYLIEVNNISIQFFALDDENGEAYEEGYIAPDFNPDEYDITMIYGSSIDFELNKNLLNIYDRGYNGREVVEENIKLLNSSYTWETEWVNHNEDGTTEDIISFIDVGLSETVLSATYAEQYSNILVSPFPIPKKKVVFTRESEEGTIYYLTGDEPFKYMLEPFYQYLCGTDLVTREGASIFNLNNSHTYFYIENGLVRLGFNKYSGSLFLAKWDIVSKDWIPTHYFHMGGDVKFELEKYSDDKIVIKAGNSTYFTIWRGHPYVMIQNPNKEISIDSKFTYCLSDLIDGSEYPYPVIGSFMNDDNLLPVCIGSKTLDYDCLCIDDDDISGGTNHTITVIPPESVTAGENATFNSTLDPTTRDGEVHYIVDGVDIGSATYPFALTVPFPEVAKAEQHTLQAVYTGDDDDNIAISDIVPLKVNPPKQRQGSDVDEKTHDIPGVFTLKMTHYPKYFTYKDNLKKDKPYVELQLLKGNTPVKLPMEIQYPNGATQTTYTNSQGIYRVYNDSYPAGNYQWGARFYDNIDADHNGKLLLKSLRWIEIKKATPTFTHNAKKGKVNKGKNFVIKLNSVESILNGKKAGIQNANVSYTINGGSKNTKKTNKNGKIAMKFSKKGTYKIKVMYAGNKNYKAIAKTFTIKVV